MVEIVNGEVFDTVGVVTYRRGYSKRVILFAVGNMVTISMNDYLGSPLPFEPIPLVISGDVEAQEIVADDAEIQLIGSAGAVVEVRSGLPYADNSEIEVILV